MNADIQGALDQINRSWRAFKHNGISMSKNQVKRVLEFGLMRGYKTTDQISDVDVDKILKSVEAS